MPQNENDGVLRYWISCRKFTVFADVEPPGTIVKCSPIIRKFRGQKLMDLLRWSATFGGLVYSHQSMTGGY